MELCSSLQKRHDLNFCVRASPRLEKLFITEEAEINVTVTGEKYQPLCNFVSCDRPTHVLNMDQPLSAY